MKIWELRFSDPYAEQKAASRSILIEPWSFFLKLLGHAGVLDRLA